MKRGMNGYILKRILVQLVFFISILIMIINVSLAIEYQITDKLVKTSPGMNDIMCEKQRSLSDTFTVPSGTTRLNLEWSCDDGCIIDIGSFRKNVDCCRSDGFANNFDVNSGNEDIQLAPGSYNVKIDARNAHESGQCIGRDSCGSNGCATYVFGSMTIKAYGQCTDECTANQIGCSSSTRRWYCSNNDADPCLEKSYANCLSDQSCSNGVCTCTPTIETCDNVDNDCDTLIDEDFGSTTCGIGTCQRTVQNCVSGVSQACTPGTPGTETCDNVDNDCDTLIDEGNVCGTPCIPAAETCNEVDDDCDGLIDDENTCCGFNNAYWEVPIDCRDKSIGAGANVSLIAEADDECSFDYDTIGIYTVSTSTFRLKNTNTNKNVDITVSFGQTGDKPIAGDWDGDGIDTIGVYRPINSMVYLSNKNYNPISDLSFNFIPSSDIALAGDWDGDGKDSIGLYKSQFSTFRLRNSNTEDGSADIIVSFGQSGDVPVVGDWDNNSIDTIGVYRPSTRTFFLKNLNTAGAANLIVSFGQTGDKPIAGDWDGDGIDTIGVYRPSTKRVFLKNSNTAGAEDLSFSINAEGDTPLSGDFDANKKNRAYIKLQVKEDDMVSYDDLSSKDPAPSTGWFGYNGKLNASWIAEYQEDESGTNPEYYFNANFLAASSEKSIKSEEIPFIKVKPCDRTKDGDCDSVDDEDDACLDTKECKEVYPNGCETPEQSECVALWDCSNVPWGDCIANQQSRGIGDCSTYANLQSGNCNCGFTGDDDDFNQCSQVFMPATEKTCLEEEAFPAFTFLNMIITILILTSFYILKKKY